MKVDPDKGTVIIKDMAEYGRCDRQFDLAPLP
jgi:hypothetical protein